MNSRRITWAVVVTLAVSIAGGVWLLAQPKTATGTFGPIAASPAYIVVNTATPVVFTAQITDPQLKKRGVVLVRLDDAGQPSDVVGRMRDDGKNGDAVAGDKIYSLRTSLNEPTVGPVNFKIAARFKPGKWSEPESDDDDWDAELTAAPNTGRDQPAERSRREKRLKKLARYTLSTSVVVTVDPFKLPPDPGEAGKQTLQGIDSDNDGVRDDVQRWIKLTYGDTTAESSAMMQLAEAKQAFITLQADRALLRAAWDRDLAAVDCLESHVGVNTRARVLELQASVLNTESRSAAYMNRLKVKGAQAYFLSDPSSLRTKCRF